MRLSVIDGIDPPEHPGHTVTVAPGSRLAAALETASAWVNSYHHQAVDRLGDGVVPVAWADDGILEALELEGDAWVLGVQWELQESWKADARFLACSRRSSRGGRGRPPVSPRDRSSSSAASSRMKRPADGMFSRSPGACGPWISGPKLIASMPGRLAAMIAPRGRRGSAYLGLGADAARGWPRAAASSGEARSGRQPG